MNLTRLKIEDLTINAGTQARASIDETVVADYALRMEEGDQFPGVIVFYDGNRNLLADGFHRVMAAERIGYTDIDADIRTGTGQDALWYALGANRKNGQRMSRGDVKHAVELALRAWPDRTQQAIADQIGCSQGAVAKVQAELIPENKLILPETRTGADGKRRPTRYKKRRQHEKAGTEDVPAPQKQVSEHVQRNGAKPAAPAEEPGRKTLEDEAQSPILARLKAVWQQATKAERDAFREWIREAVDHDE